MPGASWLGLVTIACRPSNLLVAALADRHRLAVLHYDRDYDVLADKTDLDFESVWLAEPGAL